MPQVERARSCRNGDALLSLWSESRSRQEVRVVGSSPGTSAGGLKGVRISGVFALRGQYRQHVVARLLTASTHVRADAAMLVVISMPLTLLPADAARLGAGLDDRPREFRLELSLPAQDLARGSANITAVQTQADTADQHAYVVLAEVSVGAGSAALCAVEACLDARKQRPGLDRASAGMGLQYLLSVGHDHLPSFVSGRLSPSVRAGSSDRHFSAVSARGFGR
jgi:hypothetical protein